jgi:protein-ribulosamine 3-kinase
MFTDYSDLFSSIVFQSLGLEVNDPEYQFLGSSSFAQTVKLNLADKVFFLKFSEHLEPDIFQAEAAGLAYLTEKSPLHVPRVWGKGQSGGISYMLLDFVPSGSSSKKLSKQLAEGLARQHSCSSGFFGFGYQNYIGNLPQRNEPKENWVDFYIQERLEVQLGLAMYTGHLDLDVKKAFDQLYPKLPDLFPTEPSALVHGDLWSGNVLLNDEYGPCLIDPAIHYGHREAELAFMKLFGGFDEVFYQTYFEIYPLSPGFEKRIQLYQLYPLLVHYNLFGKPYLEAALRIVQRYF